MINNGHPSPTSRSNVDDSFSFKEWRQSVQVSDVCSAATTKDDIFLAIVVLNSKGFIFPDDVPDRLLDHASSGVVKTLSTFVYGLFGASKW
jgi:hypothetical protein